MSIHALLRKITPQMGKGISEILKTLFLSSEMVTGDKGAQSGHNFDIAKQILDTLSYIFENLDTFIDNMTDDFEVVLNTFINLTHNRSLEIVNRAVKMQEELFFLFWDQSEIGQKYSVEIVDKFKEIVKETKNIHFANENIYFQSKLKSLLRKDTRKPYNIRYQKFG